MNLERRYSDSRLGRMGKDGCIKYLPSNQSQGSIDQPEGEFVFHSQMDQQNCMEESTNSEYPLKGSINL